jgi:hypothetical protein
MKTGSMLTLSGDASVIHCDGTRSIASLQYTWTLRRHGDGALITTPSLSVNPKVFLLPPYSLEVGRLYTVSLAVKSLSSFQSAQSSISVYIEPGDIHVVVQGGNLFGLPLDRHQLIDASSSYDEDRSGVFGAAAGLSFHFTCVQIQPFFQDPCSLITHMSSPSILNLSVPTSGNVTSNYVGAMFEVGITLWDSSGVRSDSASVQILVSAPSSPFLSLSSLSGRKINPQSKLKLIGSISGNSPCVADWTVNDPALSLSLSAIAQSPIIREVFLSDSRPVSEISLVIPPLSLPDQSTLSFSLRCINSGSSSSASIDIVTNSPPSPGIFSVDPKDGLSLETLFTLSALKWEDIDLPMTNEFSQNHLGSFLVLRSRLERTYTENRLSFPQNSEPQIQLRLRVFDSLNAVSSQLNSVTLHSQSLTSSQLKDFLSIALVNAESDSDSIIAALAIATIGIDSIDCGGVDWCPSLNRANCSAESFACGECLSGYLGEPGNKNTICQPEIPLRSTTERRRLSVSCKRDSDCDEDNFEHCDLALGTCQNIPKLCPRSCSGNGICRFLSMFNYTSVVQRCSIFDDCLATCFCFTGYAGTACEKSISDFIVYQDTKHLLVESLRNVTVLDNPSRDSVMGWIDTLVSLSSQQSNLRTETKILIVEVAHRLLTMIESDPNNFSSEDVSQLIAAFDISLFVQESVLASSARSLFHQFILRDMATGQYPLQVTSSLSQFSVFSVDEFENQTGLVLPLTPLQSLRKLSFPKLLISNSSANSYKAILSQSKSPTSLLNSSVTSSMSLMFDSHPCSPAGGSAHDSSCSLAVALPRISSSRKGSNMTETLPIECRVGVIENKTHLCSSGLSISAMCNGSSGVLSLTCPSLEESLTCETFNPFASSTPLFPSLSACVYHSSSETQVMCVCSFSGSDRRILGANLTRFTLAAELTVMGKAVWGDFTSTWSSADDLSLNSAVKSWKVLTTISSLGFLFVASILAAYQLDQSSMKKIETDSTLEQARLKISRRSISRHVSRSSVPRTESLKRNHWSPVTSTIQHEYDLLEQALPVALRSEPMWNKVVHEVQTYHRYVGIIFYHSPSFSRVLRIVAVGTNILIVLFVEAVTYNITNPNDGSCEGYQTAQRCLKDSSTADPSKTNCYWDGTQGTCHFREVDESLSRVISIAVICALVSAPIALFVQLIVVQVLSQPTLSTTDPSNPQASLPSPLSSSRVASSEMILPAETIKASDLLNTYREMTSEMRRFRTGLTETEKREFDEAWALQLNEVAKDVPTTAIRSLRKLVGILNYSPEENLLADLSSVLKSVARENDFFKSPTMTALDKDHRLMLLFMRDLLPGLQGQILESKDNRQSPKLRMVPGSLKLLCWGLLSLLDVGCLFYIILFSLRQTEARQHAWFQSFLIWITFDIVVASTLVVIVIHIWVPMIALKDVLRLKRKLLTDLMLFKRGHSGRGGAISSSSSQLHHDQQVKFNAAKYLFVSTAIASQHRSLSLSPLIMQFSTPWPKRSYKIGAKDVRKGYQNGFSFVWQAGTRILIYLLRSLIVLPESIQDSILHVISTSGLGYSMLLFVRLYRLSPLLSLAPVAFLAILLHFYFYSSSRSMKLKRSEIVPQVEKDVQLATERLPEDEAALPLPPAGEQLVSRKASMAQGEVLGVQMIRRLKLQTLTIQETPPLGLGPSSSDSGSHHSSSRLSEGDEELEPVEWLSDEEEVEWLSDEEEVEWLSDEEEVEWLSSNEESP